MSESDRKGRTKRVRERVGSSASAATVRRPSHRHSCSGLRGFERTRSMGKGCAHDGKGGRVVGLGCGPLARAWTHDDGKPRLLDEKKRPPRPPARAAARDRDGVCEAAEPASGGVSIAGCCWLPDALLSHRRSPPQPTRNRVALARCNAIRRTELLSRGTETGGLRARWSRWCQVVLPAKQILLATERSGVGG